MPSSLFFSEFGEYDQCVGIDFPGDFELDEGEEGEREEKVTGKYCMMRVDIPMPPKPHRLHLHSPVINLNGTSLENTVLHHMSTTFDILYTLNGFRFGICIPSSCQAEQIEELINKVVYPAIKIPIMIGPDKYCDTKQDTFHFNFKQKLSFAVIGLFVGIVSLVSAADFILMIMKSYSSTGISSSASSSIGDNSSPQTSSRSNSMTNTSDPPSLSSSNDLEAQKWFQVVMSFSLIRNTHKLFYVREDHESTLSAVHGMRILSMIWIIIGHTYCFGGFYKLLYTFKRLSISGTENPARWEYQPLINTFLLVDTFFFLGGVVLMFVALPMLQKHKGKFNYFFYAVHRWVRLTPAMIGTICFITIMPALGSGPYWKKEMTWQSEGCQKNWWMNLLFISNWVYPVDEMCGGMTWFIAADYQIYLFVAPLIFFSYYKSSALGLIVNTIVLLGGMISSGVSTYIYNMAPTFGLQHTIDLSLLHEYAEFGYFPTYHHIAPYALGTFVGYLILHHQKKPIKLTRLFQVIMWIITPACSMFILFCTKDWNTYAAKIEPTLTISVLFAATQRILWTVGVAWVSFACAAGYGGMVNDFLSMRVFIPFSRLSYSIYMVHLIPIFLRVNRLRYTRSWDDFEFISWGLLNILLGIFGAYILYIFFESPVNSLEKLLFRGGKDHHKEDKETSSDKIRHSHHTEHHRHHHNNNLPVMTTFAAYKLRSSSMSSGFSEASINSLNQQQMSQFNSDTVQTTQPEMMTCCERL